MRGVALRPSQHEQYVVRRVLPATATLTRELAAAAASCDFAPNIPADSIDGRPAFQVDLWNTASGVPAPTAPTLALLALVAGGLLPRVLVELRALLAAAAGPPPPRPLASEELACSEAFVRRYQGGGGRRAVGEHRDRSRVTVTCLLSESVVAKGGRLLQGSPSLSWSAALSGGLPFARVGGGKWLEAIPMAQGECVFHSGGMLHGALPVARGAPDRYIVAMFFDLYDVDVLPDG